MLVLTEGLASFLKFSASARNQKALTIPKTARCRKLFACGYMRWFRIVSLIPYLCPNAFPSCPHNCLRLVFLYLLWFGIFMYVLSYHLSICIAVLQLQIFKVQFFSKVLTTSNSKFLPACFTRPPRGRKPCSSFKLCSCRKKRPVIESIICHSLLTRSWAHCRGVRPAYRCQPRHCKCLLTFLDTGREDSSTFAP